MSIPSYWSLTQVAAYLEARRDILARHLHELPTPKIQVVSARGGVLLGWEASTIAYYKQHMRTWEEDEPRPEPITYLSRAAVAQRLGLARDTLKIYCKRGAGPVTDIYVVTSPLTPGMPERRTYGWLPETVDAWQAARPGRGYRRDIHDPDYKKVAKAAEEG